MNILPCVPFFILQFLKIFCQEDEENLIQDEDAQNKTMKPNEFLVDIEIIKMYMTSSNSLKIFWGITPDDIRLNTTYGLFYDIDNRDNLIDFNRHTNFNNYCFKNSSNYDSFHLVTDALIEITTEFSFQGLVYPKPKTTTQDPCLEVLNLQHCQKYFFAVAPLRDGRGINPYSSNIRSIVTYMDPMAAPREIHFDFIPGKTPCLLIKWSASCQNIMGPQRYKIRLIENSTSSPTTIILKTVPSAKFEQSCMIPVHYGGIYEISLANDIPAALFSDSVKLRVPDFIQPYDVKLTVNSSSRAFLLYWREPYVPVCDGGYFYEVFIFNDKNVTSNTNYTVFRMNRPGFVYKGNRTEYTFGVDLVCCDFSDKSRLSDLIYGNVDGTIEYINKN